MLASSGHPSLWRRTITAVDFLNTNDGLDHLDKSLKPADVSGDF
ncbi:MAG TPA: hypothetical protein VM656_16515 [Pyrinomonadaceae bacterium]|nr:hypothetical protein [Pyrinomonadaceae bacterium]